MRYKPLHQALVRFIITSLWVNLLMLVTAFIQSQHSQAHPEKIYFDVFVPKWEQNCELYKLQQLSIVRIYELNSIWSFTVRINITIHIRNTQLWFNLPIVIASNHLTKASKDRGLKNLKGENAQITLFCMLLGQKIVLSDVSFLGRY